MSQELKVISGSLKSRGVFEIANFTLSQEDFTEVGWGIFKAVEDFYAADPNTSSADSGIISSRLSRKFPKHAELFSRTTQIADELEVSLPNIRKEIAELREHTLRGKLVSAISSDAKFDDIETIYAEIVKIHEVGLDSKNLENSEYVHYQCDEFDKLLNDAVTEDKIGIYPESINEHLGGLPRQYHVVLFGRPDIGKSTVCINMVCGFLNQGLKTVYFGNEDPIKQTLIRVVQCLVGVAKEEVEKNWSKYLESAKKKGLPHLNLVESPNGSIRSLERIISKNKPDVVVVDQLRNLNVRGDTRVLQLENTAKQLRELAKKYNLLMLSVNQAGDSAQNKTVLDMGDMDWSNTGIQGACDLIIGIGANSQMEAEGRRYLSFPKNKVNGNKDPLLIKIDTRLARIH